MSLNASRWFIQIVLLLSAIVATGLAQSAQRIKEPHRTKIEKILAAKEEPAGVVFEIVTGKNDGLEWALPLVKDYIARLRKKFPELEVAVVTHGREQFALTTTNKNKTKVHSLTQQLNKEGVQLHVCGTYAGWRGLTEEDFPEYVNVATTGPAQVNDYIAVGYTLVVINKPE